MKRTLTLSLLIYCTVGPAVTESQTPYAGLESRGIKALSQAEIEGYTRGDGMGFALAAELNGYPGPKHVLELAGELGLSPEQTTRTHEVFDAMQRAAAQLGDRVVQAESRLDAAFADGSITPEVLTRSVSAIGLLLGELRAVHLAAHLETRALLSVEQVERYAALRGYDDTDHSAMQHHKHGHSGVD